MRNTTKRIAAVSAAIAGVALIGSACQAKEKTENAVSSASSAASSVLSSASSAVAPSGAAEASTTELAGPDGKEYAVSGPILEKYESLASNQKGDLGGPLGAQQQNPDGGVFQQFEGGVIIHSDNSYVVWGKIRDKWNELDGSQGKLGYPTSDETDTADGAKKQTFQHGVITWTPGQEAVVETN